MPDSSLGFELAVKEAKEIFHKICPDEEFMLAVPNSEDIIWGTTETEEVTTDLTAAEDTNNDQAISSTLIAETAVSDELTELIEKDSIEICGVANGLDDELMISQSKIESLIADENVSSITPSFDVFDPASCQLSKNDSLHERDVITAIIQ